MLGTANNSRPWRSCRHGLVALLFAVLAVVPQAYAAYGNVTQNSQVDPTILKIDEEKYLGTKLDRDYLLVNADGTEFALGDMLGKPLILALSYYRCDGACPTLNRNLNRTLEGVGRWKLGQDYRVLTVSFDRHDNPESLGMFKQHAGFKDGLPAGWRMTTFKNPEDIQRLTGSLGYKFFWSPRDAVFLHPSVYIMLSPEGRVTRFLYGANIDSRDMELSITKAFGSEISPANVINFVIGACYSYNYKDGKYTVNIPLFVATGALVFGLSLLGIGILIMKKRRVRDEHQIHYA